ncbi:MAG: pseudoazurin [Gammaproteobacteria bacterium]|jgi:pseudoazurin|nr:pseudoazurin [Gammaproteobacteria bacterium]|tara:strand:+ start:1454 stop:1903 length:450 start_codon:yes stop_codon:yes gene_type:complete
MKKSLFLLTFATITAITSPVFGEDFEVTMLNQGTDGVMVFEPSVLKISVGDTVTFKPTNPGHNSASIAGMIPTGSNSWDGGMSQEVKVTFTEEGTYVYQCTPHLMMAMVGVIAVGDASVNLSAVKDAASEKKSEFMMSAQRLDEYLEGI